jgi:hypothetical protein
MGHQAREDWIKEDTDCLEARIYPTRGCFFTQAQQRHRCGVRNDASQHLLAASNRTQHPAPGPRKGAFWIPDRQMCKYPGGTRVPPHSTVTYGPVGAEFAAKTRPPSITLIRLPLLHKHIIKEAIVNGMALYFFLTQQPLSRQVSLVVLAPGPRRCLPLRACVPRTPPVLR